MRNRNHKVLRKYFTAPVFSNQTTADSCKQSCTAIQDVIFFDARVARIDTPQKLSHVTLPQSAELATNSMKTRALAYSLP
jgi:hypothetical protein